MLWPKSVYYCLVCHSRGDGGVCLPFLLLFFSLINVHILLGGWNHSIFMVRFLKTFLYSYITLKCVDHMGNSVE